MKNDHRVLSRKGARELTPREVERITGAIGTLTACSIGPMGPDLDAKIGEC